MKDNILWQEKDHWIEEAGKGLFYVVKLSDSGTHGVVVATCHNRKNPKWAQQKALCELFRRVSL